MNKLTLILLLFTSLFCNSQNTITTYLDEDWKETSKSNASYFRKSFKTNDKKWAEYDYFISGKIQMTSYYKTDKKKKKIGEHKFYYENGKVSLVKNFNKKGKLEGKYKKWYENGNIDTEGNYNKKGEKYGEWKWYHENGKISAREIYLKNEYKSGEFWNEEGVKENSEAFSQAQFPGGLKIFYKNYLTKEMKYPKEAILKNISGKVYISFVVEKNGEISNIKIEKSVHKSIDQEALRVIKKMPNWIPGKAHNRTVRSRMKIPISFQLT